MHDYFELASSPSYQDSLKLLESDVHHANLLAASIPRGRRGAYFQMNLAYNQFAPILLMLLQWMDCSCTCLFSTYLNLFHVVIYKVCSDGRPSGSTYGRKASIREFYGIILPSLQRLHGDLDLSREECQNLESIAKKGLSNNLKLSDIELEREDECGICLEPCPKLVLPNCCHSMCINCYRDWSTRSESCPFCRGTLKRVSSGDLWVLTCSGDVVDTQTLLGEDTFRFYLFINNLPKEIPDALFVMYYEYLM